MKVQKTCIYKLEVLRDCGCKIAGDFKDNAYKTKHDEPAFSACETHKEMAAMVEEIMRELLNKEALEAKAPEVVPIIHPRTAERMVVQETDSTQAPVRTLRSSGEGRTGVAGGHRPANAPPPTPGKASHRPEPKQSGGGGFKRTDGPVLSTHAAAALGKAAAAAPDDDFDIDMDLEPVAEDSRVTNLISGLGLLDDEDDNVDFGFKG